MMHGQKNIKLNSVDYFSAYAGHHQAEIFIKS